MLGSGTGAGAVPARKPRPSPPSVTDPEAVVPNSMRMKSTASQGNPASIDARLALYSAELLAAALNCQKPEASYWLLKNQTEKTTGEEEVVETCSPTELSAEEAAPPSRLRLLAKL